MRRTFVVHRFCEHTTGFSLPTIFLFFVFDTRDSRTRLSGGREVIEATFEFIFQFLIESVVSIRTTVAEGRRISRTNPISAAEAEIG